MPILRYVQKSWKNKLIPFFQLLLDELSQHVDGRVVMSSLGDDDIRETFTRLDELFVHGFEYALIALNNLLCRTSTLQHVALHDTNKTVVRIGIYEDLQVHLLTHSRLA